MAHKKSGKYFFACKKFPGIFFRENPYPRSPTNQNYSQRLKKWANPPKTSNSPT